MSVIVGIEHKNGATIGSDSMSSDSGLANRSCFPRKLFKKSVKNSSIIIGVAGSFAVINNLSDPDLKLPSLESGAPFEDYVRKITVAIRKGLSERECLEDGKMDAEILLAAHGQIAVIGEDFWFETRPEFGYFAIGSGAEIAMGSLHSTKGNPADRAIKAIMAASDHRVDVGGDVLVEESV